WAERRRIEAHPRTGAIQIVEVRERVEEAEPGLARLWSAPTVDVPGMAEASRPLFGDLTEDQLLGVGVPADWIKPVRAATEDGFFEVAERLPAEAAEALLEYAATGVLASPGMPVTAPSRS